MILDIPQAGSYKVGLSSLSVFNNMKMCMGLSGIQAKSVHGNIFFQVASYKALHLKMKKGVEFAGGVSVLFFVIVLLTPLLC